MEGILSTEQDQNNAQAFLQAFHFQKFDKIIHLDGILKINESKKCSSKYYSTI